MTMTSDRTRQPKGIPAGGEFAAEKRGEASDDVALTHNDDFAGMSDEEFTKRAGISPQELRDGASALGHAFARTRPGLDPEEIAGDSVIAFVKACRSDKPIRNPRAYLKMTAKSIAVHQTFGTSRGPDITAMSMWLTRRGEWQTLHSSLMTPDQEDALADAVRDEIIASGKQAPTLGFHRRSRLFTESSLDAMMTDDDGKTREFAIGRSASHHHDIDPLAASNDESRVGEALNLAEGVAEGEGTKATQKAKATERLWEVMAQTEDAPSIAIASQTSQAAKKNAETVESAGGVRSVAHKIIDGDLEPKDEVYKAFAAPWGSSVKPGDVENCARIMSTHPDYADQMWALANRQSGGAKASKLAAASADAPKTAADSTALGSLKRKGGVAGAAKALAEKKCSQKTAKELLGPWRNEPINVRRRAIQVMLQRPAQAESLWLAQEQRRLDALGASSTDEPAVDQTSRASMSA